MMCAYRRHWAAIVGSGNADVSSLLSNPPDQLKGTPFSFEHLVNSSRLGKLMVRLTQALSHTPNIHALWRGESRFQMGQWGRHLVWWMPQVTKKDSYPGCWRSSAI